MTRNIVTRNKTVTVICNIDIHVSIFPFFTHSRLQIKFKVSYLHPHVTNIGINKGKDRAQMRKGIEKADIISYKGI